MSRGYGTGVRFPPPPWDRGAGLDSLLGGPCYPPLMGSMGDALNKVGPISDRIAN